MAIPQPTGHAKTPCEEAAGRFIQAVKDMKKRFGIGDHIPEIQETDIPKLAHYADKEANPLYPVPVLMDAPELEQLLFYFRQSGGKRNYFPLRFRRRLYQRHNHSSGYYGNGLRRIW